MDSSELRFFAPKGVLKVWGEDAATFLQGQFSQDLEIEVGETAYGLWLNRKGKILADSFVGRTSENDFWVLSYCGDSDLLKSNLEDRIIMDEVETEIPGGEWIGVSLWGTAIGLALEALGMDRPEKGRFELKDDVYAFWGREDETNRLELVAPNEGALARLEDVLDSAKRLSSDEVSLRSIANERFEVGLDIGNDDLPQEVGLGEIAVSYSKGCYIGQEVMARLKSMGRPRRVLLSVVLSGFPHGEGPWAIVDQSDGKAGELRRVFQSEDGVIGSAMLKSAIAAERLKLKGQPEIDVRARNKQF